MTSVQTKTMTSLKMRYNFQTGEMEPLPAYLAESANLEHDDYMTAEDYDSRRAIRDGWTKEVWDGR